MKSLLLLLLLLSAAASAQKFAGSQATEFDTTGLLLKPTHAARAAVISYDNCFQISEMQPCFKNGGHAGLQQFLWKQLRCPPLLQRIDVEGATTVRFTIDAAGFIRNPTVVKSLVAAWDDEVLRVVKLLNGQFEPATYNGQPFDASVSLKVPFEIR